MSQARWVGDDHIRNEWTPTIIYDIAPWVFFDLVEMCAIAHLEAGSPTPIEYLLHLPTSLLDRTTPNRAHIGKQPGILDHECHQLRGIATDMEELELSIEDKFSKSQMRGETDPMPMSLEFLSQSDKWLNVPAGSNHLDDDVEMQREIFAILLWYPGGAVRFFGFFELGWYRSALEFKQPCDTRPVLVDPNIQAPIAYLK